MSVSALKSQRLALVDALRGFALMGLFIVHAVEYFELYWYKMEIHWIHDFIFFLFSGKMAATFALLFGVAFHTVMVRYADRGVDFRGRFAWRFAILAVAGYIHGLLYAGDILLHLALNGFLLVLVCRLPTLWISLLTAFCLLLVPTLFDFYNSFSDPSAAVRTPEFWALSGRNFELFATGSFMEVVRNNAWLAYEVKYVFNFETGKFWVLSGFVLLGYGLSRLQFFENCAKGQYRLGLPLLLALGVTIALYIAKPIGAEWVPKGMSRWYYNEIIGSYFNYSMIVSGILLFIVAYRSTPLKPWLDSLGASGRMSLTLYLLQSVVCVPLFYGFGLAWYESIGQGWALVLGIVLWGAQMLFAHIWFKAYAYGPFEWGWRALTLTTTKVPFRRGK